MADIIRFAWEQQRSRGLKGPNSGLDLELMGRRMAVSNSSAEILHSNVSRVS
jgi:hypothetical protein